MPELAPRRRGLALAVCSAAILMVGVDVTALNVALPAMERELSASVSGMQWAVAAYSLGMATLMLYAGSTADRIGRKKVLLAGIVIFTVASVLCALAPSLPALIGFRILQGVGAAGLGPVAMAIVAHTFPERHERTRAMGMWMGAYGLGLALGPVVGGVLVDAAGWRSVFWLNVPFGIAASVIAVRSVPESRAERPRRPDPVGQLLVMTLLAPLAYGIIEAPRAGWTAPAVIACFVVAVASCAALLAYERRRTEPLIELGFFHDPQFGGAIAAAVAIFGTFGGFFFLTAIYLQNPLRMSAAEAGLWMLVPAGVLAISSLYAARLAQRYGARSLMVGAGVALAASGALIALFAADSARWLIAVEYVLFGLGVGLSSPLMITAGVSGMPEDRAGLASGMLTTFGRSAFAMGVAVLGAILNAGLHGAPLTDAAAFTSAVRPAWWILAAGGVTTALLGFLITGKQAADPEARCA
ncbi:MULTISPECIES: MFS transporter [Streptomyces]|uniref:MFS transporter n=1 Tax=Streptomyces TaxID=1883 RepID=UPI00163B9F0C|nr:MULTISPECIES: MFS transporter [Streptomyces]MBC2878026.1 MFS transporter [Streptomyces sp. TYQ1024]UBI39980.1 MFS transporter [Streptomyces mobaraensis]UKW32560.1 MFS transporter [Streptomyces sp. TYQ1024]